MLTLISYPAAFGLPSASPFVLKAMGLLRLSGEPWEAKPGDPRKSPKSKLPVLLDGADKIADSEDIRAYLEQKTGRDFDKGLDNRQRAVSRAVIRMMDEHLYFILVCDRWLNDANWPIVRETFFGTIPKPVRGFITNKIRAKVRASTIAQGVGRHSETERFMRANQDIQAILALLGDQPFLFGDAPTAADASAGPMIASIAASPTPTMLSQRINEDAALMAYLERVRAALYPA